jgi:two-component system, NtrC family, sensor kinase
MKHISIFFYLILYCSVCFAQSIVFTEARQSVSVAEYSTVLVEKTDQTISIDSLLKHSGRYSFVPAQQTLADEPANRMRWFRFEVQSSAQSQLHLASDLRLLTPITLYLVEGNQLIERHRLGPDPNDKVWSSSSPRSSRVLPLQLNPSRRYTLYWHSASLPSSVRLVTSEQLASLFKSYDLFWGLYFGLVLLIILYNLLLYIQLRDFDHLTYAGWVGLLGVNFGTVFGYFSEWIPNYFFLFDRNFLAISNLSAVLHILFALLFLQVRQRSQTLFRVGLVVIGFLLLGALFSVFLKINNTQSTVLFSLIGGVLDLVISVLAALVAIRQGFRPAWFFLVGILLIWVGIVISYSPLPLPYNFWRVQSIPLASMAEIIVFTLGLSYKVNLLKKQREKAIHEQLVLAQQNQQLIEHQKSTLERLVDERTSELRASQALLVQKEKLASLGELTAGIAHEIQNPLNFVNNFSEVSTELVEELKEEVQAGRTDDVVAIANDLTRNLMIITQHGKRADAIVRGMLEHSRISSGEKQPTDLNQLAKEHLRMAFQGKRAKDMIFDCRLETNFAADLPIISVVSQDIGRVLLNLYNNALYAVHQKRQLPGATFEPTVWVSTQINQSAIVIEVRDNGMGIPASIQPKIFHPFFTTKPAGEGTGLGLSLSYDIITNAHGGQLTVESQEGKGTAFLIRLPIWPQSTDHGAMNNTFEHLVQ